MKALLLLLLFPTVFGFTLLLQRKHAPARRALSRPESKYYMCSAAEHSEAAAMALLNAGRYRDAGLAFECIVEKTPGSIASWTGLSLCLIQMGKVQAALACKRQAARLHEDDQHSNYEALEEYDAAAFEYMEIQELFRDAREFEFNAMTATGALPSLSCGRQLSLELRTFDECDTGGRLWTSAIVSCRWLQREAPALQITSILELGSGVGAVGLFAAASLKPRRVTLTDGGPSTLLALIASNVAANSHLWHAEKVDVIIEEYSWGDPVASACLCGHDLVLGSDVTYAGDSHEALCSTIAAQLRTHSPGCRVVLAHEHRNVEGASGDVNLNMFVATAESMGLRAVTLCTETEGERRVSLLDMLDERASPEIPEKDE